MRMMSPDEVPRTKTIGILSGCAIALFVVSAWLIVWAGEDTCSVIETSLKREARVRDS